MAGRQPIRYLCQILSEATECTIAIKITVLGYADLHFG